MQKAGQCFIAGFIAVLQSTGVKCTAVVHMCVWTQVVGGVAAPTLSSMLVGSTTFVGASPAPPISLLLPHFARPANDRVLQCRWTQIIWRVLIDFKHLPLLLNLCLLNYPGNNWILEMFFANSGNVETFRCWVELIMAEKLILRGNLGEYTKFDWLRVAQTLCAGVGKSVRKLEFIRKWIDDIEVVSRGDSCN